MFNTFIVRNRGRALLKLLLEERQMLLSGRFSDLANLDLRRKKLMESVTDTEFLHESDLAKIRQAAERNRFLLKASLAGVTAANALLDEGRKQAKSMGTYTVSGKKLETAVVKELNSHTEKRQF